GAGPAKVAGDPTDRFEDERPMPDTVESRLAARGLKLPGASAPAANYVPAVPSGNMLYISGQIPMIDGELRYQGKLGAGLTVEDGQACARLCALNIIAQAKAHLGDLERVRRVVKLT